LAFNGLELRQGGIYCTTEDTDKGLDVFSVAFGVFGGDFNERGQRPAWFLDSRLRGNDNHLKLNTENLKRPAKPDSWPSCSAFREFLNGISARAPD